jgi:hypothetical protein
MTSRDFAYWLQGFLEISQLRQDPNGVTCFDGINQSQLECIQKHLALVFKYEIDPSQGPKAMQDALNNIHSPPQYLPPEPHDSTLYRC